MIVNIVINDKHDVAFVLAKEADELFYIQLFDMNNKKKVKEFPIHGNYITGETIEMNETLDKFALAYMDDGNWHLLIFDFKKIILDLDINSLFGIENDTLPISGYYAPFATCCFLKDQTIYYNFFRRRQKLMGHFVFNPDEYKVTQQLVYLQMTSCTMKNFPQRTYYDQAKGKLYTFYRQGQALYTDEEAIERSHFQKITNFDIGEMEFYLGEVLIVRSSHKILFFKLEENKDTEKDEWQCYHSFDSQGRLSGNRCCSMFQIIQDDYILFYEIQNEDFIPKLENVMMNFLGCGMMIYGEEQTFCITFKMNQANFFIYQRKLNHDFMVTLNNEDFENSLGINIKGNNTFLVAREGEVIIYDDLSYEEQDRVDLGIGESDTREPLEILSFNISHDYQFVAVFIGKQLIKDEELLLVLSVLKLDKGTNSLEHILNIDLEKNNLSSFCKQLYFDMVDSSKLILVSGDKIIKFDYTRE